MPTTAGHANLHCTTSGSNKVYNITLEPSGTQWVVNVEYGKFGAASLNKQAKTPSPVEYASALKIFTDTYTEKKGKGYVVLDEKLPDSIAPAVAAPAMSKMDLSDRLKKLLDPVLPNKMPVLLEGLPGTSKTYSVREFGNTGGFDQYTEAAGHGGMESYDFLGGMIPIGSGKTVWMDGPVTLAFRAAAKGRKVLLCIDEINRVPARERGLFLNALSPHDGKYRLRTGRPVNVDEKLGTASMEMLLCPVENISIVATTNSGSNFITVEEGDTAEKERWHIIHLAPTKEATKRILESRLTAKGWPMKLAKDVVELQDKIETVKADNYCATGLSLRLALRVLDLAESPTREGIATAAREMIPALTGRTPEGDIIAEQAEAIGKAIDRIAPAPAGTIKI